MLGGVAAVAVYFSAQWLYEAPHAEPSGPVVGPLDEAAAEGPPKGRQRDARPGLGVKPPAVVSDDEALQAGALPGQRVLVFQTKEQLEAFLQKANARGISVLGRIDQLNALRVAALDPRSLAGLSDDEVKQSLIFPVSVPDPKPVGVQADAVALGSHLTDWLNISGDRSTWGNGVKVAVLDTGVVEHRSLGDWSQIALVPLPSDGAPLNPHGLAVSSLITGNNPQVNGAAPGAELLSVVVADGYGQSDTYTLARGILAAVDAGAAVINISMGSYGDSALMRNAVEYAQQHRVVLVAAAGNDGASQIAYPAAYASSFSNVVAVGAVDATGAQLQFSNSGSGLTLMAPGYAVNAAFADDRYFQFTGTSGSAPVVTGTIAAMMSHGKGVEMSAQQAVQSLVQYADEGGAEGNDASYGQGLVDLGRALQGSTPGLVDVAVASQWITNGKLHVVVENRGTDAVLNPAVDINVGGGNTTVYVNSLNPGETRTVTVPYNPSPNQVLKYSSQVRLSNGQKDARPANNGRDSNPSAAGRR